MTLVSALFDLRRREPATQRRSVEELLRHGKFVLGLDADLVIFVDPELGRAVRAAREEHGLLGRTRVVEIELESLEAHRHLDDISNARHEHPIINANARKDTPLGAVLGWAKFELIRRPETLETFDPTHLAWIDLGIAHVADTTFCQVDRVFTDPPGGPQMLMLAQPDPEAHRFPAEHYRYVRGQIAAGFLGGTTAGMTRLAEAFEAEARGALRLGFAGIEEQILVATVARDPGLCCFHRGDYPSILANVRHLRGSAANLLSQLRQCRAQEGWEAGAQIADAVIDGCRLDTFDCEPWLLSDILDECFIALYRSNHPDQARAREVAELYAERARTQPAFRDAFLRDEIRIRTNWSFLTDPVTV
jgi:hypothetical protein